MAIAGLILPCLLSLTCHVIIQAAPSSDLVTDLPGLSFTPDFSHYSGFLQGVGGKKLHYWLVESPSKPETHPLAVWLGGGPGCSALPALLDGNGPFRVKDDGVTVDSNPHAWNQVANLVYLEAPAGVGFSFSEDKNYTTDDVETAKNSYLALKDLVRKFPEYEGRALYIAGSGYGGVYVPSLVDLLQDDSDFNLKGFLVGNGLTSYKFNINSRIYFVYYHGLLGEDTWAELMKNCCPSKKPKDACDFVGGAEDPKCSKGLQDVQDLVWSFGLNPYNLFAECAGGVSDKALFFTSETQNSRTEINDDIGSEAMKVFDEAEINWFFPQDNVSFPRTCLDDQRLVTYLNASAVRDAIHIPKHVQTWSVCSEALQKNYQKVFQSMREQYADALKKGVRIMVYSGDTDMAFTFQESEAFTDALHSGNPPKKKPWYYKTEGGNKQIAGFFKKSKGLLFATVKGAGHFVAMDKPALALHLFTKLIENKDL